MRIQLGAVPVTQCAGGNHRHITVTVGGQDRIITIMRGDASLDQAETNERIKDRIISALKESGATLTLASWNTALSGKALEI